MQDRIEKAVAEQGYLLARLFQAEMALNEEFNGCDVRLRPCVGAEHAGRTGRITGVAIYDNDIWFLVMIYHIAPQYPPQTIMNSAAWTRSYRTAREIELVQENAENA
jgi:hypothetical protein